MKLTIWIALLAAMIQFSMAAPPTAVSAETAAKAKSLLGELPSQLHLWQYHKIVNNPPKGLDANNEQIIIARQQVDKVHAIVPQFRKLLKVGASVFSYPGLLAHGDISYGPIGNGDPFASDKPIEKGYRLYMGLPVGITGHRYDLEITFDSAGIIREINDVHGKE